MFDGNSRCNCVSSKLFPHREKHCKIRKLLSFKMPIMPTTLEEIKEGISKGISKGMGDIRDRRNSVGSVGGSSSPGTGIADGAGTETGG